MSKAWGRGSSVGTRSMKGDWFVGYLPGRGWGTCRHEFHMPRLPIHFDQPRGRRGRGGQRRVLLILHDNETPGFHGAALACVA